MGISTPTRTHTRVKPVPMLMGMGTMRTYPQVTRLHVTSHHHCPPTSLPSFTTPWHTTSSIPTTHQVFDAPTSTAKDDLQHSQQHVKCPPPLPKTAAGVTQLRTTPNDNNSLNNDGGHMRYAHYYFIYSILFSDYTVTNSDAHNTTWIMTVGIQGMLANFIYLFYFWLQCTPETTARHNMNNDGRCTRYTC